MCGVTGVFHCEEIEQTYIIRKTVPFAQISKNDADVVHFQNEIVRRNSSLEEQLHDLWSDTLLQVVFRIVNSVEDVT